MVPGGGGGHPVPPEGIQDAGVQGVGQGGDLSEVDRHVIGEEGPHLSRRCTQEVQRGFPEHELLADPALASLPQVQRYPPLADSRHMPTHLPDGGSALRRPTVQEDWHSSLEHSKEDVGTGQRRQHNRRPKRVRSDITGDFSGAIEGNFHRFRCIRCHPQLQHSHGGLSCIRG